MVDTYVILSRTFRQARTLRTYRIATQTIAVDTNIGELEGFASGKIEAPGLPSHLNDVDPGQIRLVFQAPGWIGGQTRQIACWAEPHGYRLHVSGDGAYRIMEGGKYIIRSQDESNNGTQTLVEAALGPALILALALRNIWCLHASAVIYHNRLVVFLGESGVGKSTLAYYLGCQAGSGWSYLTDDVLPVSYRGAKPPGELIALPRFPQLKYSPDQQPSLGSSEQIPVDAIYVLDPPAENGSSIHISRMKKQDAMLAMIHHTIAARLFDRKLLSDHLTFCANAVQAIKVSRLTYPRDCELLPDLGDRIAENVTES